MEDGDWVTGPNRNSGAISFGGTDEYGVLGSALSGFYDTLAFFVNLPSQVTAASSGVGYVGDATGTFGIFTGMVTAVATDETLMILDIVSSTVPNEHIRQDISAGWRHFAFTWNGSKYLIHVDGVAVTQYVNTAGHGTCPRQSNRQLTLARRGSTYYVSTLADFRVYNRALSVAEIAAIASGNG
jgi:hypothetical protein